MIKNIIGAAIGSKLAKQSPNVDNGTGAAIGAIAPVVLSRMSLPLLVAVGAGGYLLKRRRDNQNGAASDQGKKPAPKRQLAS
jgi:hypothetical protein